MRDDDESPTAESAAKTASESHGRSGPDPSHTRDRRAFLLGVAGGVAALAGCSGDGGGSDGSGSGGADGGGSSGDSSGNGDGGSGGDGSSDGESGDDGTSRSGSGTATIEFESSAGASAVEILEHNYVDGPVPKVNGTAKNPTDSLITYVEINSEFYDGDGNKLGEGIVANKVDFKPGATWEFQIVYAGGKSRQIQRYKLIVGSENPNTVTGTVPSNGS